MLEPFWDNVETIFVIQKMKKHQTHVLFDLFCLVAVLFYLARDGEGDGGTILEPFWDHFICCFYLFMM